MKELEGQNSHFQVPLSLLSHPCSLLAAVCQQLAATWHLHYNIVLLYPNCVSGANEGHDSSLITAA